MITAESKPENVIEAKKAGVNNYIVKPFNADTLRTKLSSVLGAAVLGKHGRRHDRARRGRRDRPRDHDGPRRRSDPGRPEAARGDLEPRRVHDRKSTRLNSRH